MARMPDFETEITRDRPPAQETTMSIEEGARNAIDGHYPQRLPGQPLQIRPATALQNVADALRINPLAAQLLETGLGQNLTGADLDTVMRVVASIEAARIEVPTRYERAQGANGTPDGQG